ncbi:hypothetical protein ACFYT3_30575 [Nocardia amikacinitolerans]|uniref:hypothetical protein n=1 Tax=Nocardia amikacinitolerans TaxID=756689 RepID=UPI0036C9B6D4
MTRDKRRKQAARQHSNNQGIRYTRALRELSRGTDTPRRQTELSAECATVRRKADDVADRLIALQHVPAKPVAHRADHLGQCLSRVMYSTAVDLAHKSAVYVQAHASSGIVDEMSLHHARQVLGHLTRASAATRETLAEITSGAREHAVQLLQVTESAMVESCQMAKQVRMSRNEWFCDVTGMGQTCAAGTRDLRLQVRDGEGERVVEMPPGCVDHVAEEIVTWSGIPGVEVEVLGDDRAAIDLAQRLADTLRETEHWLLGPQWWEQERALAPGSPFTALFR